MYDKFIAYVASLVHDLGHDGFNNHFHVETASNLALLYQGESVLENYHISETFKIQKKKKYCDSFKFYVSLFLSNYIMLFFFVFSRPECNIISNFNVGMRRYFNAYFRNIILGTDMKHHGSHVASVNEFVKYVNKIYSGNSLNIKIHKTNEAISGFIDNKEQK